MTLYLLLIILHCLTRFGIISSILSLHCDLKISSGASFFISSSLFSINLKLISFTFSMEPYSLALWNTSVKYSKSFSTICFSISNDPEPTKYSMASLGNSLLSSIAQMFVSIFSLKNLLLLDLPFIISAK